MLFSCLASLAAAASVVHAQSCPAPAPAQAPAQPETVMVNQVTASDDSNTQHEAAVQHQPDTVLSPVPNPAADPANKQNIVPATSVSLLWGGQADGQVHVSLEMNHPTVLLEDIGAIRSVDCEPSSVTVVFSRPDAFKDAISEWSMDGSFVLLTNHLGDCDAENERGVFLAKDISFHNDTLTVVALGEKTDINSTAGYTEITFDSIPVHSKRGGVNLGSNGLTLSHSVSLPPATKLYSYHNDAPLVDVQVLADKAELSMGVTFSGKLRYSLLRAKLHEMSFDIDAHASVDLGLSASLTAEYNASFAYKAPPLTYSIVKVPGIVSLGPALDFAIGADLSADTATKVTTDVGAQIADGNFHIDFLDRSRCSSSGWKPTFHAAANISEHAAVTMDPYVDVTAKLDFELLGGLLDLSGGMTARPKFNNDFTLTGSKQLNATWHKSDDGKTRAVSRSQGNFAACAQGLGVKSDFDFSLVAFVTQWWSKTIYSVNVPIAEKCYSWA